MAAKHKNIYLFLTLACFLGIVLIFLFDGYMGVYDSLRIDNGQYVQTITTEQWEDQERYGFYPSVSADRDRSVEFTYVVENHRFSAYTAAAFGKAEFTLVLDPGRYLPPDFPAEQSYNMTVVVSRDGVERRVMVYVNPGIPKPIIPPVR
jgi:hypothetical protein